VTRPQDEPRFRDLLGDGSQWGTELRYATQQEPNGIPEALTIGEDFLDDSPSALILGDNIFYGHGLALFLRRASAATEIATIFGYRVIDPERYGVIELDDQGQPVSIAEKPAQPRSQLAVTGLYFYPADAPSRARGLTPSARGETEISDLNQAYLSEGLLNVETLDRGFAWLDAGTHESLHDASLFVRTVQQRQGLAIASPEEVAFRLGYVTDAQLERQALAMGESLYRSYLLNVISSDRIFGGSSASASED
jgi:glucose-1-phosphate thymidylyltransferase